VDELTRETIVSKAAKKSNPILHEIRIRGFTYKHIQPGYRKPVFPDNFYPLGGFLRLFLLREITIKARALFHLPYTDGHRGSASRNPWQDF